MNRHPSTIRARALAALLLLAVLWPLGMGNSRANDAGPPKRYRLSTFVSWC